MFIDSHKTRDKSRVFESRLRCIFVHTQNTNMVPPHANEQLVTDASTVASLEVASASNELTEISSTTTNNVSTSKAATEIAEHRGIKLIPPFPDSPPCNSLNLIDSYIYLPGIPDCIKEDLDQPCVLGVDEAGRGPVLGPMVYGVCYCPLSKYDDLKNLGFADSKTLKEEERDELFETLEKNADIARSSVHVLSPQTISTGMLRGQKYNLNEMAHEATMGLIRRVLDKGINITEIYVDTVGPPSSYQAKLSRMFPGIDITVAKKADSTYPIVSAASIVAKVTRDAILKKWKFIEPTLSESISQVFGSGYPSDPNTVRWLNENLDPVFGYPNVIRFSWSTTATILEKNGKAVIW
ncbi:hypothetical protein INT43_002838 [Umbelopsis isabellina]|uniref:Ribonuclease n=1 Tax=Mortierella isabellina TaxID=91625 RepID=A0A8H7Q6E3_MORIS|nr:hypothetical protein INT43_002838 [Umbelopsis isabellina]